MTRLEFVFLIVIIVLGFHFFNNDENKNSDLITKSSASEVKKFVKVIFKKDDNKKYDYFLGDNSDIQVGDFVEVLAHGKFSGKDELKIVQVVYISSVGEISYKATKTVVRKSNIRRW